MVNRFDANVHAGMAGISELDRNRLCCHLTRLDRLITVHDLMIGGQQQLDSGLFTAHLDLPRRIQHLIFDE
jgi:hypothetical protein